jgi:oxaloacetate decarboxylase beta subunit
MCFLSGRRINPLIGAAGISAFPMSGRVVQKVAQEEDFSNFILMHAMGANTAGQLGSVVAGGVLLALVQPLLG